MRPPASSPLLSRRRRSSSTPTGSTRKVVAVGTVRLSVMLATSLAWGPLIGEAPAGRRVAAAAGSAGIDVPSAFSAALDPLVTAGGRSPTTPLSNRRRQSGPTVAGSLRNSSYIAWAKPALAVSNTFGSTTSTIPAVVRAKGAVGTAEDPGIGDRKITVGQSVGRKDAQGVHRGGSRTSPVLSCYLSILSNVRD